MPKGTSAVINGSHWQPSAIFQWLQRQGNVAASEMYRTFNCGVGMVIIVSQEDEAKALAALTALGEEPFVMGEIKADGAAPDAEPVVSIDQPAFSAE
jgi:phosphoribosylformylglycinamidine cyclo-ligase